MEAEEGARPGKGEGLQGARRDPEWGGSPPASLSRRPRRLTRVARPGSAVPARRRLAPPRLPRSGHSRRTQGSGRTPPRRTRSPKDAGPAPSADRSRTASAQSHRVGRPDLGPHLAAGHHA
uniref:Uncharacterized protein n=1 Tax=Myotis myotis TaxID=51298 RepID=A0A7J7ZXK6_MYOMY|nr:hypothetical protein mMyoMyo1_009734 [Myotis myotis]